LLTVARTGTAIQQLIFLHMHYGSQASDDNCRCQQQQPHTAQLI